MHSRRRALCRFRYDVDGTNQQSHSIYPVPACERAESVRCVGVLSSCGISVLRHAVLYGLVRVGDPRKWLQTLSLLSPMRLLLGTKETF